MKTMYRVEERVYTDCEGKYSDWATKSNGYVATVEEAEAIAATVKKENGWDTGDWRIVARTINEETFTVEESIVESFSWWEEIGCYEHAKKNVERYTKAIAELEASKARCKTANGIARKEKEIAWNKEMLAMYERTIAAIGKK